MVGEPSRLRCIEEKDLKSAASINASLKAPPLKMLGFVEATDKSAVGKDPFIEVALNISFVETTIYRVVFANALGYM